MGDGLAPAASSSQQALEPTSCIAKQVRHQYLRWGGGGGGSSKLTLNPPDVANPNPVGLGSLSSQSSKY